ncbi:LysM peptidoglycan-binding domain-containing protein [Microseira sp. BLCC-F43]|uniref:CIS tube protein n=1 Tax=Microseira sp. BLCC-F43 TaxID=3153602 RepID=UPI0035BA2368
MELEKLTILGASKFPIFDEYQPIIALFNPQQISISKTRWQGQGNSLQPADESATLTVELFFDTSLLNAEQISGIGSIIGLNLSGSSRLKDVRKSTIKIYQLTEKKSGLGAIPRPPICRMKWGRTTVLFQGFIKQLNKTFTRFLADGTPVRAKLNCRFEEWISPEIKQKEQNPIDRPIRIVRRGETLTSIAAEEYNNPALWRVIAAANRLDNPRQITPGQRLTVPPL